MAAPTRDQIDATVAHPKIQVEIWSPDNSAWYTIPITHVEEAGGSIEVTGNSDNGVSFGNAVEPSATVRVENTIITGAGLDKALNDEYWLRSRMRINYTFENADYITAFVGTIVSITEDNYYQVVYELSGMLEYVRKTKLYTTLQQNRPVATETTVDSIEDPTAIGYVAGTVNEVFWQAGGRPLEQAIAYPETDINFKFYYSCVNGICNPEWTWISGENLEEELYSLVRAAGGQIYQDSAGVLRYTNPLLFGSTTGYADTYYQYNTNNYVTSSVKRTSVETVAAVNCLYTTRSIQPVDVVYDETKPRLLQIAETQILELTTQLPIYEYTAIDSSIFVATYLDGNSVTLTINSTTIAATKILVSITNPSSTSPIVIHSIKIYGRALQASEENLITYGSGVPAMNVDNNPYIQNRHHAQMLAKMLYDFYNSNKLQISLSGCPFDTDRFVGELVYFVTADYIGGGNYESNFGLRRITKINYGSTATFMDIELVSVVGLPVKENHYIIGTSYVAGDTRLLSY